MKPMLTHFETLNTWYPILIHVWNIKKTIKQNRIRTKLLCAKLRRRYIHCTWSCKLTLRESSNAAFCSTTDLYHMFLHVIVLLMVFVTLYNDEGFRHSDSPGVFYFIVNTNMMYPIIRVYTHTQNTHLLTTLWNHLRLFLHRKDSKSLFLMGQLYVVPRLERYAAWNNVSMTLCNAVTMPSMFRCNTTSLRMSLLTCNILHCLR